jgi:hypothetical protein
MRDNTTPRPWSTSREDMDSFTVNQDDTTGETEHVVYIYRGDQPRIAVFAGALNNARADANFIVEAVNSWSDRVARAMANETPPAADPRVAEAVKDDANVLALIEGIVKRFGWRPFETENLDVWLPRQLQMAQAYQARTPNGRTLAEAVTETQTILDKIIDDYDPDDASADGMITRVVKAAEALADRP